MWLIKGLKLELPLELEVEFRFQLRLEFGSLGHKEEIQDDALPDHHHQHKVHHSAIPHCCDPIIQDLIPIFASQNLEHSQARHGEIVKRSSGNFL